MELASAGSRLPRRLVWSVAMVMSAGLVASAGWQVVGKASELPGTVTRGPETAPAVASLDVSQSGALDRLGSLLLELLDWPAAIATSLEIDGQWLVIMWGVASSLLFSIGADALIRYRKMLRGWPVAEIEGVRVRVSTRTGPAVAATHAFLEFGMVRGRIQGETDRRHAP
jgi:hypothetical protein